MDLPSVFLESGTEDLSDSEENVDELFATFIAPIDNLRSRSRPIFDSGAATSERLKSLSLDGSFPLESRVHAFYRALGFPVASETGEFYNSGFNPELSSNAIDRQKNIENKVIQSNLGRILSERELLFTDLRNVFSRQNFATALYGLVLKHPRPYSNFEAASDPFENNKQNYNLDLRTSQIQEFLTVNPNLGSEVATAGNTLNNTVIGTNFNGGSHPLLPISLDPRIVSTVMPENLAVCAPFLSNKNATRLSGNIYLPRPGIELILRLRLQSIQSDEEFLADVDRILAGKSEPSQQIGSSGIDLNTIRTSVSALSDGNELTDETRQLISGFTDLQSYYVVKLNKLMRNCLRQQVSAIQTINNISSRISWLPLCSIAGPETGAEGATLWKSNITPNAEIDFRISELRIRKLNAERPLAELSSLGTFASPFANEFIGEKLSLYESELQFLYSLRSEYLREGFKAMSTIEKVSGEISGLGLVDVLAMYTALWAIDLPSLLGFLDSDSLNRLRINNPSLAGNLPSPNSLGDSYSNLITLLFNLLSFADTYLLQQLRNPLISSTGEN